VAAVAAADVAAVVVVAPAVAAVTPTNSRNIDLIEKGLSDYGQPFFIASSRPITERVAS
jgi:hypothetical protein